MHVQYRLLVHWCTVFSFVKHWIEMFTFAIFLDYLSMSMISNEPLGCYAFTYGMKREKCAQIYFTRPVFCVWHAAISSIYTKYMCIDVARIRKNKYYFECSIQKNWANQTECENFTLSLFFLATMCLCKFYRLYLPLVFWHIARFERLGWLLCLKYLIRYSDQPNISRNPSDRRAS